MQSLPQRHISYIFGIDNGSQLTVEINGQPTDCVVSVYYKYVGSVLRGSMQLAEICNLEDIYKLIKDNSKNLVDFSFTGADGTSSYRLNGVSFVGEEKRANLHRSQIATRVLFTAKELIPKKA